MARTMFERYGGFANVSRVVSSFYDKILDSPVTSPYFAQTDMKRLVDHQTKFVAHLMGGPASYSSEHLTSVHSNRGISEEAFAEAMDLLSETLEDFDFEPADIRQVEAEMLARKPYVVIKD
jgi:hemoglobin